MGITELLKELNYRVLAEARDGKEARQRLAVVAHWASEQQARLAAGKERAPRLDTAQIVAEALGGGPPSTKRSRLGAEAA